MARASRALAAREGLYCQTLSYDILLNVKLQLGRNVRQGLYWFSKFLAWEMWNSNFEKIRDAHQPSIEGIVEGKFVLTCDDISISFHFFHFFFFYHITYDF